MGKTKTKIMDDSVILEPQKAEKKLGSPRYAGGAGRQVFDSEGGAPRAQTRRDDLVERLKAELADVGVSPEKPEEKQAEPKSDKKDVILGSEATPESKKEDAGQDSMTKEKKPQKQGKTKPRGKKYQELVKDLDKTQNYPLIEAIELIKKGSYSKFTGTLEAHINTISTNIRGLVSLPFASGKKLTILAFGKEADKSGADIIGSEEVIENINKGKLGFDLAITTPEWMPKLAKVARILGPRGLMPNPKNGTITEDLKKAVEGFQGGKTEYKTEAKSPVIHIALGKLDQPTAELTANIKTLLQILGKSRVKKVTLSPTMGPSVKLDLSSL